MNHSVIVSLAVLKANWDVHRRDYIDNFLPFVAECVRTSPDDIVSLSAVRTRLRSAFHFELPLNVVQIILRRMAKTGLVRFRHGAYTRGRPELAKLDFDSVRREAVLKHESLVQDLVRFCHEKHQVTWTIEQGAMALEAYINDDQLRVTCIGLGTHIHDAGPMETGTTRYLVGSYIQSLYQTNSTQTESLETIVQGNMLANAVFLPEYIRC